MSRPQKKHHYIYKTTCLVTGKFYVGMHSTDNLDDGYLGSGKILGYSIAKHGRENHKRDIIEMCPSREALKLREKEIVNEEMLDDPLNINLKYGGEGGQTSEISKNAWLCPDRHDKARLRLERQWRDSEYRKRMVGVLRLALHKNHLDGKIPYNTYGMLGKKHTAESCNKMSVSHTGSLNPQFGKCWVCNGAKPISIYKKDLDEYLAKGFRRGRK